MSKKSLWGGRYAGKKSLKKQRKRYHLNQTKKLDFSTWKNNQSQLINKAKTFGDKKGA